MVIQVHDVMENVHTTAHDANIMLKIFALHAMTDITLDLLGTVHQNVYLDVKHARQELRAHHVRRDITIPAIYVIVYVQVTVSRVRRIPVVCRARMVIITVTKKTTLTSLC
jgi:hypothetical protein